MIQFFIQYCYCFPHRSFNTQINRQLFIQNNIKLMLMFKNIVKIHYIKVS